MIYAMTNDSPWVRMDFEDMEEAVMLMKRRSNGQMVDNYYDRHGCYIIQIMYPDAELGFDSIYLKDTEPDKEE